MISRPRQYDFLQFDKNVVSDGKNDMSGFINRGFEENLNSRNQNKTYLSLDGCDFRSIQPQIAEEESIIPGVWIIPNRDSKKQHEFLEAVSNERPVTFRNKNRVKTGYGDGLEGVDEQSERQSLKTEQLFTRNGSFVADDQSASKLRDATERRHYERVKDVGAQSIKMEDRSVSEMEPWGETKQALRGSKVFLNFEDDEEEDEDNYKVVYKCRRNPPINPSIIVTTEPFEQIEKLRQINEDKAKETAIRDKFGTIQNDDNDVRGAEGRDKQAANSVGYLPSACEETSEGNKEMTAYSLNHNSKGIPQNMYGNSSALPITEINDLNDPNDFGVLYSQVEGDRKRDSSAFINTESVSEIRESATPILNIGNDQSLTDRQAKPFEKKSLKKQQAVSMDGDEVIDRVQQSIAKPGKEVTYGNRNKLQQISISETVKLLRKKRNAFANRKNSPKKRSRGARSTESSLKSTDADDGDSDVSTGRDELHGVFKNLHEQHKMIEKRSDALINFRPDNRCDTRLISTAYEMASAVEQQRQATNAFNLSRAGRNAFCRSDVGHGTIELDVHALQTSKPSTSTSYYNADSESLKSRVERNKDKWAPNWLYTVFAVLIWNSVVAFMHGIEGDKMTSCNRSIKWRLWCTITGCVVADFLLEHLYEKRGYVRAVSSSLSVFLILLLTNEHPLVCYSNGGTVRVLNYLRASLCILLAACLFIVWLKNGHFNLQRLPNKYDCSKQRKLSELPISDFEDR